MHDFSKTPKRINLSHVDDVINFLHVKSLHLVVFFLIFNLHDTLFISTLCCFAFNKAVAAEKAHISLINGVEHFDKTSMKHTETEEKNPLPPMEGKALCLNVIA
jgi:Thymosin beta-4 family